MLHHHTTFITPAIFRLFGLSQYNSLMLWFSINSNILEFKFIGDFVQTSRYFIAPSGGLWAECRQTTNQPTNQPTNNNNNNNQQIPIF